MTPGISVLFVTVRPKSFSTWPDAIEMAAADVNPAITGTEKNSMRNPNFSTPKRKTTMPVVKANKMANSGGVWSAPCPFAYSAVIRDMMAVGPTVMSLELPKMQYTKPPMKAEYRPYWRNASGVDSDVGVLYGHTMPIRNWATCGSRPATIA